MGQEGAVRATAADIVCGVCDGDTGTSDREFLRNFGSIIISNPDMLHYSILPQVIYICNQNLYYRSNDVFQHKKWKRFISNLKYVIIDEAHVYKYDRISCALMYIFV